MVRVLAGLAIGAFLGLAVIGLVLVVKPPFLVDTPRSEHPVILVLLVAVPAVIGALIALVGRGARRA